MNNCCFCEASGDFHRINLPHNLRSFNLDVPSRAHYKSGLPLCSTCIKWLCQHQKTLDELTLTEWIMSDLERIIKNPSMDVSEFLWLTRLYLNNKHLGVSKLGDDYLFYVKK